MPKYILPPLSTKLTLPIKQTSSRISQYRLIRELIDLQAKKTRLDSLNLFIRVVTSGAIAYA